MSEIYEVFMEIAGPAAMFTRPGAAPDQRKGSGYE